VEGEWGMWDSEKGEWEEDVLRSIAVSQSQQENGEGGGGGSSVRALVDSLKKKLGEPGEVEFDGGRVIGKVGRFMVERFGFGEECIVLPCECFSPVSIERSTKLVKSHLTGIKRF